jgi:hypothetical protein
MSRFSTLSSVATLAKAQLASSASAFAVCAALIAFAVTGPQPAWSQSAPQYEEVTEDIAPTDPVCAKADLKLLLTIEGYEDGDLNASPTLIDAATLLQFARKTCAGGDVANALTIYTTATRQLDTAARELNMPAGTAPSDVARR